MRAFRMALLGLMTLAALLTLVTAEAASASGALMGTAGAGVHSHATSPHTSCTR